MDVHHAPERPIHSTKDFFLALTTITVGILIAMSLEGVVTWAHHRALVREAKARLAEEIADNRREVNEFFKNLPGMQQSQAKIGSFIDDRLNRKPISDVQLMLTYTMMALASTSWTSAQTTGAVGYMEYADVQKYASAYSLQAKIEQLQDRMREHFIGAARPPDPEKASVEDLRQWQRDNAMDVGYLDGVKQLAEQLLKEYDKFLPQR